MPRFYFDSANDHFTSRDEEGIVLPDVACAKSEAVATLTDLAREFEREVDRWSIRSQVRTESGELVFQATLSFRAEDVA